MTNDKPQERLRRTSKVFWAALGRRRVAGSYTSPTAIAGQSRFSFASPA